MLVITFFFIFLTLGPSGALFSPGCSWSIPTTASSPIAPGTAGSGVDEPITFFFVIIFIYSVPLIFGYINLAKPKACARVDRHIYQDYMLLFLLQFFRKESLKTHQSFLRQEVPQKQDARLLRRLLRPHQEYNPLLISHVY